MLSCVALSLLQKNMFQWVRNSEGRLIKIHVLQESNAELNISLNLMEEHLEEGQQSQQLLERNPNPSRSMRDYRTLHG